MATNNTSNQDFSNNADGFALGGGTTERILTVTGGNATITGSGSAVVTLPTATSTLATLALTETLTNKTLTAPAMSSPTVSTTTVVTNLNADTVDGYHGDDLMPVGAGMEYWGSTLPSSNWLFAFGQSLLRTDYPTLFARLGVVFGSADGTHFNLPDKRGRVTAGQDNMGGTSANRLTAPGSIGGMDGDILGNTGGQETHVQTTAELAVHTHSISSADNGYPVGIGGTLAGGITNAFGRNFTADRAKVDANTGGDGAANVVQPTIIANYIIKVL